MSEIKTYDLEDIGNGYQHWREMVEQKEYEGDWVLIEDFKNLEQENAELKEELKVANEGLTVAYMHGFEKGKEKR